VNGWGPPIDAALFDLDDTLFLQEHWLDGAWWAVADAASDAGVDRKAFHHALVTVAAEGSGRGRVIDRALAAVTADAVRTDPLVAAFRAYRAPRLPCLPRVKEALLALRSRIPIGLVTDGDLGVQHGKLASLGLMGAFDVIIYSDRLGRDRKYRKPSTVPFLAALYRLDVLPETAVFVGDRPDKDIAGATSAGMRTIRVQTGEYSEQPDDPAPWTTAADAAAAIGLITRRINGRFGPER
jgi:putative hydrolase of the HAD superfamily